MRITLLEDNTVSTIYKDGSSEVINSTHSHKAKSKITKAIADAFPYKGAMENVGVFAIYDSSNGEVQFEGVGINPETVGLVGDLATFCNIIWDNGGREVWEAKQALIAL